MKINKQKHGKENTIGKIIYGFLMFMPLMAILTTCAYVIINKNAYQSYSNQTPINEYIEINNLPVYNVYFTFNKTQDYSNFSASNNRPRFILSNIEYIDGNLTPTLQESLITNSQVKIWYDNRNFCSWVNANTNLDSSTYYFTIKADIQNIIEYTNINQLGNLWYRISYNNYLDNVFYYSIDKVEQSPLFSWATNTETHNVLESTCQTLGITTPFVPMLLAYWLMMSLMYLLYDIALLVVHMAHNRIHDIESNI